MLAWAHVKAGNAITDTAIAHSSVLSSRISFLQRGFYTAFYGLGSCKVSAA